MPLPFQGTARALSQDGLAAVASSLGVFAPEIWTVLTVETSGCGYLPDRRPQILYERHVFHRLTGGKYDDDDISAPSPGDYGASGGHQYERLSLAMAKNRNAALQSVSWGIGQILGEYFAAAGFADVEAMVAAMSQSEDRQLAAMGNFLISNRLERALQTHDWTVFARGYNGPNYAINRYDVRLTAAYQKYSSAPLPDLNARAVQLYLTYLGFDPGPVDGIAGNKTLSALARFQRRAGFPATDTINADTVAHLQAALASAGDAASAG